MMHVNPVPTLYIATMNKLPVNKLHKNAPPILPQFMRVIKMG